jgi:hypothetical protein
MSAKYPMLFVACSISFSTTLALSQVDPGKATPVPPRPSIGWDSLAKQIEFPRAAREAGIEGLFLITVHCSKEAVIDSIDMRAVPAALQEALYKAVHSTKWLPARKGTEAIPYALRIPVEFHLWDPPEGPKVIVNAERVVWVRVLIHGDATNQWGPATMIRGLGDSLQSTLYRRATPRQAHFPTPLKRR